MRFNKLVKTKVCKLLNLKVRNLLHYLGVKYLFCFFNKFIIVCISGNFGKFEGSFYSSMRPANHITPIYLQNYILVIIAFLFSCCNNHTVQVTDGAKLPSVQPFRLSSSDFANDGNIPALYTCDSTNISPELHWNNPFTNTKSFALLTDDPDVSTQPLVHWIVYNIPSSDTVLQRHFPMDSTLSNGIKQGFTSFRLTGYEGPCPPNGIHRYYFKLYALDTLLNVPARLTKTQLITAMGGHILAEANLMGRYTRIKNNQ